MYLATATLNGGDLLFQLIMFTILLAIPATIVVAFLIMKKRNNRLKQVEEKLDKLLEKVENKNS